MASWLDRYSRKIVGWDMRELMPEDLVIEAPGPGRAPAFSRLSSLFEVVE